MNQICTCSNTNSDETLKTDGNTEFRISALSADGFTR